MCFEEWLQAIHISSQSNVLLAELIVGIIAYRPIRVQRVKIEKHEGYPSDTVLFLYCI